MLTSQFEATKLLWVKHTSTSHRCVGVSVGSCRVACVCGGRVGIVRVQNGGSVSHAYSRAGPIPQQCTSMCSVCHVYAVYVGLARTIYIRCIYGIFGREITKFTVIYGVYIRFWPTLCICLWGDICKVWYWV